MNQISLDAKGGQFLADLANWQRESAPDNSAGAAAPESALCPPAGADEAAAADAGALLRSGTHHGADRRQPHHQQPSSRPSTYPLSELPMDTGHLFLRGGELAAHAK